MVGKYRPGAYIEADDAAMYLQLYRHFLAATDPSVQRRFYEEIMAQYGELLEHDEAFQAHYAELVKTFRPREPLSGPTMTRILGKVKGALYRRGYYSYPETPTDDNPILTEPDTGTNGNGNHG